MKYKTQYTSDCKTAQEAQAELAALATQVDFGGGRLLTRNDRVTVQAIFPDYGEIVMDGCRRVLCSESFMREVTA
jgi:hypothetical protein